MIEIDSQTLFKLVPVHCTSIEPAKRLYHFPQPGGEIICTTALYSPCLGLAPVQVVDGVAPVILVVPAERREAHAHVQPRNLCANAYTIMAYIYADF